ncbi:MAG: ROK family protein [Gemmatimonadales bacterium]
MIQAVVGVDLGGTSIVVGVVPSDGGAVWGLASQPTPVAGGPPAIIAQIAQMVNESVRMANRTAGATRLDVRGIGIGAPGPLDTRRGIVLLAPNLNWHDVPLRDEVARATGLPAALENDANCATLGEWWRGAARDGRFVVGITVGTGIGGGIVLDGRLYHGAADVAGEIGHTTIAYAGRRCACGNYGCLEAYASGPAIAARAHEALDAGTASSIETYVGGDRSAITAATVYQAANDGDPLALEIVTDTARYLGTGIANIVNVLNPDLVVVQGGVTLAGDRLLAPLRAEVSRRAFRPAVSACRIVPGTLTGTAGVYGAAAAFRLLHDGSL